MITFFTIPKPFIGHTGIIQTNAIRSWTQFNNSKVLLFCNDQTCEKFAIQNNLEYYSETKVNSYGTPLISDIFEQIGVLANTDFLIYINSDIILFDDPSQLVIKINNEFNNKWFAVGQRTDLDIYQPIIFENDIIEKLRKDILSNGVLHGLSGIDYFIFPKLILPKIPDFAVGRPGWDNWLIYFIRKNSIPLVNVTKTLTVIHQNHPPMYKNYGIEALQNKINSGGYTNMATIRESNWRTSYKNGEIIIQRNLIGFLYFNILVRIILSFKRNIFQFINKLWS